VRGGKKDDTRHVFANTLPGCFPVAFRGAQHLFGDETAEAVADEDKRPLAEIIGLEAGKNVASSIVKGHRAAEPRRRLGVVV
jgi:hypothetical protein